MVCRCPSPPFSLLRLFRSLFFPFCAAFFSFQRLPPFLFSFLLWSFLLFVFLLLSPVLAHFSRSIGLIYDSSRSSRDRTRPLLFTIPDVRAQTKVGDRKDKKGNTPRGSTGAQHPRVYTSFCKCGKVSFRQRSPTGPERRVLHFFFWEERSTRV